MKVETIQALRSSLLELERTICYAGETLEKIEPQPEHLLERIQNYRGIIAKQKAYASELEELLEEGRYEEVTRHAKLINGLTKMIYDDAKSLATNSNHLNTKAQPGNQLLC